MHVGLDLSFLEPQSGGSGTYARELTRALRAAQPDLRITAWAARGGRHRDWPVDGWVELPVRATGSVARVAAQLAWIGLDARRRDVDVLHGLAYAVPVVAPGVATVVTIHDLTWRHQPASATWLARRMFGLLTPLCGRAADRVIAVSEHAKADLVATYGLDPGRIHAVLHGVAPRPDLEPAAPAVPSPYLLSVGQLTAHKNLEVLVDALPQLDVSLVLPGRPSAYGEALARRAAALGVRDRLHLPGYVDDAALEGLYAGAAALVVPSLHEGFGMPLLEAMQHGVPVACSDASALPEVAGGAARLFDARSPDAVAVACRELLADPQPWIERGRARAATLTWDRTARATLAVYQRALGA